MFKLKQIISIIIFVLFLNIQFPIFADDNFEEEVKQDEINKIISEASLSIQTANTEIEAPSINSRHAIVYDRTTRKSFIW